MTFQKGYPFLRWRKSEYTGLIWEITKTMQNLARFFSYPAAVKGESISLYLDRLDINIKWHFELVTQTVLNKFFHIGWREKKSN